MKKFLSAALIAGVFAGAGLARDVVISAAELPKAARDFIGLHFPGTSIALVKKDLDSYDVSLSDGSELDFDLQGQWSEVDTKFRALPASILPQITQAVTASQKGAFIYELSRELGGYKFKLSNRLEIYTDPSGKILGQKMDD